MSKKFKHLPYALLTISLAICLLTAGAWHFVQLTKADITETVTVTATVLGCGDSVIQPGEDCDTANMNGYSCLTEGFLSGSISCTGSCSLNTTACSLTPASGGSNPRVSVSSTNQIFTGYTSPEAIVTIFKDGEILKSVTADATGSFYARVTDFINGSYTFGFKATDTAGNSSALTTVSLTTYGGTNTVSDIFLSPTISPLPANATEQPALPVSGQSTPSATVTVTLYSPDGAVISRQTVPVRQDGTYATAFNTSVLSVSGTYYFTSIAQLNSLMSSLSLPAEFPVNLPAHVSYMPGDYNENLRVNLVDFSIALFWYQQTLSNSFKILELRHGNGDGVLNLIDISIMAYWWTG